MDIIHQHITTYDLLASEYDERADSLRDATEHAVERFAGHLASGRILDVGCGAGLLINVLNDHGYEAEGIDISPEMVKVSQRRNPGTKVYEGDFLTYDFEGRYDAIFAFAFIHLYPKVTAHNILQRMQTILKPAGMLYVGTTDSPDSREGFESKSDYGNNQKRFRKHWTRQEFAGFLAASGFEIIDQITIDDPFGKKWMDFIVQKSSLGTSTTAHQQPQL